MKIRVQALAGLMKEDLIQEMDVPAGCSVKEVSRNLPLKNTVYLIYLVNGSRVPEDYQLKEGDSLVIFPPVLGG
jgi:molybdopterin converting factor small subunit